MERLSPSSMITNKKGERGSSCRIPLEGVKFLYGTPLTRMENKDEEVALITQLTQL
jgi:hypothetical protein